MSGGAITQTRSKLRAEQNAGAFLWRRSSRRHRFLASHRWRTKVRRYKCVPRQLTLSVNVNLCEVVPLVAVTVTIWFASTGVPGFVGAVLPPPPHAAIAIKSVNINTAPARFHRRRRAVMANPRNAAHRSKRRIVPVAVRHPPKSTWRPNGTMELGAVVETVNTVVPLPVTVAGLKLHVLSDGKPVQDAAEKLIAPLYPLLPVTVTVVVALAPGALTLSAAGANEMLKSGPGVTTSARLVPEL